jgi:ribosomal protein S27AE
VRREFKKTLWGEELDNERYSNPVASSLELELLYQNQGKKHQCKNCGQEFNGNMMFNKKQGIYCSKCYQILFQRK